MNDLALEALSEQQLEDLLAAKRKKKQETRDTYQKITEETVVSACKQLAGISVVLAQAKRDVFSSFKAVLQLKEDVFGIKEKQRSHTFTTDKYSITIGYRVNDGWDDTVTSGVAKVNKFIQSLARDDNSAALVETVFNLLKKDANGNLRANRVIELQKLTSKFNDAEFTDGVSIIMNAYKPVRSCWFIDAFSFNDAGEKVNIPLSISAADFPEDFDLSFFAKPVQAGGAA
ncbi:DUF3164 family protein [Methylomonas sp. 2BW1-5-20]|uniref:DUF3164 family protein n=1 Tax=Methylomonas sp. 2BW1-5-20 TaxID=3376686 RepID=UPI0040520427